jgi:hypothetical protein
LDFEQTAHIQAHAQALDRRTQLCVVEEKQEAVEELRALAQYQLQFIHLAFLAHPTLGML